MCWGHAALQLFAIPLLLLLPHCGILPEAQMMSLRCRNNTMHDRSQKSWREAIWGATANAPFVWAIRWALICSDLIDREVGWTLSLQPAKKHAVSASKCCGCLRKQGRHDTKGAKPHICQQGNVYLDFWVKRKEVLSSIISAQFVQLICLSSILGQRKALILLPGLTSIQWKNGRK